MLTKRENLMEVLRGGNPDRFVKQYEAFEIITEDPYALHFPDPKPGQMDVKTGWGATKQWPEGFPGAFPVHDEAHIVCKDVADWKDYVKAPPAVFPEEDWAQAIAHAESVDRKDKFVTAFIAPGLFEQCHYLLEIQNCLMSFYEEPEAMKELINYIADWEVEYAKQICKYMKPDALFHHDDWGTQISTFISPAMFEEFYLEPYKRVYKTYKDNGVELIIHHSDSYAETLVPYMVEMGIDIWQGVMTTNNIPKIIEEYGPKITLMGGINSASIDHPDWTRQEIHNEVQRVCKDYGKHYFIPCASQGGPYSTFDGVYATTDEEIDLASKEMF